MAASLTVLSGPLAGTRLDIDGSEDEILLGADAGCRLVLDLPGVSPIHARLSENQGELIVHDTHSPHGLYVNDTRVSGQAPLRDGDVLWLGKPGDETSIMLQCRVAGAALPVVVMPEEDLSDRLAVSPAEPPPPPASPVAPAPAAPSEDVFFMEEPAAPAAAAPPPPSPPPPAEDNLFFVEEPFDASASPPASATAPVRPAPAPEPPPVPPPKASAAAKPAPPPIRRHGPTPPPSAAPERDDEAEPPRPRSVAPRPVSTPRAATAPGGRRSSPPVALIAGAALLLVAVGAGVLFVRSPRAPAESKCCPSRARWSKRDSRRR